MLPLRPLRTIVAQAALLAAVYALVARVGLDLDSVGGFATLIWPASGIALAALLAGGERLWPGVALGALAANLWGGAPLAAAAAIAAGNTAEALLAARLLRATGFEGASPRLREVLGLVVAALGPTAVAATAGVSALLAAGTLPPAELAAAWRAWWLGDMAGILVVTPLLLAWRAVPRLPRDPRRLAEAASLALATGAVWFFVFHGLPGDGAPFRQAYVFFPLVIWAGLRLGPRSVATTTLLVAVLTVAGTAHGQGPFVQGGLHASLLRLQVFLVVVATTGLVLAAAMSERRAAETAIRRSRDLLERAEAEERRRGEEVTRLYGEARDAIEARDEFLSVASHELRTPLSALMLQLSALRRLLSEAGADGKLSARAERALRATDRLARLVEGLLDVSRIASGRLQLALEECDLADVAREVVDRTAEQASAAGCSVRVVAAAPATGRWDRLRLEQVIGNLLSNAMKYGPGKPVTVCVEATDDLATLSVRDSGIGISSADCERIFGRFERAVPLRHYGGLGLGLYIAQQIVGEHGGTIRVTSEPEAGATFMVELPRRRARAAEPLREAPREAKRA